MKKSGKKEEEKPERNGEGKEKNYTSLIEYYKQEKIRKEDEKKERLDKAKKLKENWELMRLCVEYIEENEEFLKENEKERDERRKKEIELWEWEEEKKKLKKKDGIAVGKQKQKKEELLEKRNKLEGFWKRWRDKGEELDKNVSTQVVEGKEIEDRGRKEEKIVSYEDGNMETESKIQIKNNDGMKISSQLEVKNNKYKIPKKNRLGVNLKNPAENDVYGENSEVLGVDGKKKN